MMKKNAIKNILDLIIILLAILSFVLLKIFDNLIVMFIPVFFLIITVIIERIMWRCPKCGNYLPNNKAWFEQVICCPYCKANIDE